MKHKLLFNSCKKILIAYSAPHQTRGGAAW